MCRKIIWRNKKKNYSYKSIDATRTLTLCIALDLRCCTPCIEIAGVTPCTNCSVRPSADTSSHPVPKHPSMMRTRSITIPWLLDKWAIILDPSITMRIDTAPDSLLPFLSVILFPIVLFAINYCSPLRRENITLSYYFFTIFLYLRLDIFFTRNF